MATSAITIDYAHFYETEFRLSRRIRRAAARLVWIALFLVRPRAALDILQSR